MFVAFKTLRGLKGTLNRNTFCCRAYDNGKRRLIAATGNKVDGADFGRHQHGKASELYDKL